MTQPNGKFVDFHKKMKKWKILELWKWTENNKLAINHSYEHFGIFLKGKRIHPHSRIQRNNYVATYFARGEGLGNLENCLLQREICSCSKKMVHSTFFKYGAADSRQCSSFWGRRVKDWFCFLKNIRC